MGRGLREGERDRKEGDRNNIDRKEKQWKHLYMGKGRSAEEGRGMGRIN